MPSHRMLRLLDQEEAKYQRRSERHRVLLSVQIVTTTNEQNAKLRNLSEGGAMVEMAAPPAPGTDVILRRGALEIFARVVWSANGRCGLSFDEPLSEDEMWAQLRPGHLPAGTPCDTGARDPGSSHRRAPHRDDGAAGNWAHPVGRQAYLD